MYINVTYDITTDWQEREIELADIAGTHFAERVGSCTSLDGTTRTVEFFVSPVGEDAMLLLSSFKSVCYDWDGFSLEY